MHTAQAARGRGLGRLMVEHLIAVARDRGYVSLSLETGSMAEFAPARALYASAGFELCQPFGDYRDSPNSTYMTLRIVPTLTPNRPDGEGHLLVRTHPSLKRRLAQLDELAAPQRAHPTRAS